MPPRLLQAFIACEGCAGDRLLKGDLGWFCRLVFLGGLCPTVDASRSWCLGGKIFSLPYSSSEHSEKDGGSMDGLLVMGTARKKN